MLLLSWITGLIKLKSGDQKLCYSPTGLDTYVCGLAIDRSTCWSVLMG